MIWKSPPRNWIKINYDDASLHTSGPSACGGIITNHKGNFLDAFTYFLGASNSFIVKLSDAISVIEFAKLC